jgi:hypothetical protein
MVILMKDFMKWSRSKFNVLFVENRIHKSLPSPEGYARRGRLKNNVCDIAPCRFHSSLVADGAAGATPRGAGLETVFNHFTQR